MLDFEKIKALKFDKETMLYSITEGGFKYEFPPELYNDFKSYIFEYHLVSRWYKHLSDKNRSEVIRQSAYENKMP